ncbi:MAG: Asp-tRNA(Asn)/Glu-tRNA(Gln) amidotransferase subunit GatC [Polyangiales bacterium]
MARLALVNEDETSTRSARSRAFSTTWLSVDEVDVSGVEPTFHSIAMDVQLRRDEVLPGLSRVEALEQESKTDGTGFSVPRVVEAD